MAVKGHNFWKVWISRDVYILCIYDPAWDQILIVTLFAFKLSLLLSPVTSNFLFTICCYTYLKSLSKKNYTHLNIVFIITLFIKAQLIIVAVVNMYIPAVLIVLHVQYDIFSVLHACFIVLNHMLNTLSTENCIVLDCSGVSYIYT